MKDIMVAYDGDAPGHRALAIAAELAQALRARGGAASIVLCSVVPESPLEPTPLWDNDSVHARLLAEASIELAGHGIAARAVMVRGDPAVEISRAAVEHGCDTIVVGTHATAKGIDPERSVAAQLALHADAAVVVVAR
ncbi:MAG: universal stress protein [Acidimicrobiia bacterium]